MSVLEARKDVRTSITEACERVLTKIGYQRMTMADVAAEARLSRRTLYLHFPTKEALVRETMAGVVTRTQAAMEKCLDAADGRESLKQLLTLRILVRLEQVSAFHNSLDDVVRDIFFPYNTEEYFKVFEPEVEIVARGIERGIKDRSLRKVEPRETAEVLIRATNGFLPSNLSKSDASDLQRVKHKLELLVSLLLDGMAGDG